MARKTRKTTQQIAAELDARREGDMALDRELLGNDVPTDFADRRLLSEQTDETTAADAAALADIDTDDGENEASVDSPRSVVKSGYKQKYIDRANAMARKPKGVPLKALKRMTADWLAIELAKLTLDPKAKLVVSQFEAVLDANGIAHAHWNRTTKGWQGRLRMTGRLALERVVAAEGVLHVPGGTDLPAPRSWVAAHTH